MRDRQSLNHRQLAPKLKLFYSAGCPFCIKVFLAMLWLRLQGKLPAVTLANVVRPTVRQQLIDGGGKKQVPCLAITDSQSEKVIWLYESTEIIDWFKRYATRR